MARIIGNTTATPNPQPDWNQADNKKADYIKNKPPINKSRFKGYYYQAIDFSNKQIYLCETQVEPTTLYEEDNSYITSGFPCNYEAWDQIVITDSDFHYLCGTIESVDDNVITLKESLKYNQINHSGLSSPFKSRDYFLFVPNKPDVGLVEVSFEGLVIGDGCKAFGNHSFAQGYKAVAVGDYSHAEGRGVEAKGYSCHAEGYYTSTSGDINAFGQHVQGRYNIEDDSYEYAHIVGNGTDLGRSNAHTLDWDGNAWFAGDVFVGENNEKLSTIKYVDDAITQLNDVLPSVDQNYSSTSDNPQSGKAVAEALAQLVDSAPETLDTLNELAEALGNDDNFATTVTNALALKADMEELDKLKITAEIIDDVLVLKQGE